MSSKEDIEFIKGSEQYNADKQEENLSLCYGYPILNDISNTNVITNKNTNWRKIIQESSLVEDGLYSPNCPFVYSDFQFSQINNLEILKCETNSKLSGKLLDIVIREVNISSDSSDVVEITSVHLLFNNKIICKAINPFNRKLHKLLIKNSDCNNLSIQVYTKSGQSSILPLPLPNRNIKNSKLEIDFAIRNSSGSIHAGTVMCTISLNDYGQKEQESYKPYLYKLTNDPNDPQNALSLLRPLKNLCKKKSKYFLLEDPALIFGTNIDDIAQKRIEEDACKLPDVVVAEQPAFSLFDVLFRNWFGAKRPLETSFGVHRHHTLGKTVLSVSILRGIEIPIREESALVQPFVEVEWSNTTYTTSIAEGPAPVWQQTMQFEFSRQNKGQCIMLRLYDQHPVWGQQWLGEARIPFESHRSHQELEQWITLSPLYSPVLLFGYVQASPGQSCTRIYVLVKIGDQNSSNSIENNITNKLLKGIQQCLVAPYKITGMEHSIDIARLVMLIPSLPDHYGPVTPRQALNIKKVDHYGRAALLAVLLRGLNLQTYVLIGSSQVSKWTSFVLSVSENGIYTLWDPEVGKHYNLDDSNCPLTKVYRLLTQSGIWENLQKSILPNNLKYDVKLSKEWRSIETSTLVKTVYPVQVVEFNITDEEVEQIKKIAIDIEQALKDKLSDWRSAIGLTTIFNRHAMTVLRNFVSNIKPSAELQLDKKVLKQLYRAYHVHGFILNQRENRVNGFSDHLRATKTHDINGPVEFALICHVQPYVGKICSVWIAVVILRSRN